MNKTLVIACIILIGVSITYLTHYISEIEMTNNTRHGMYFFIGVSALLIGVSFINKKNK